MTIRNDLVITGMAFFLVLVPGPNSSRAFGDVGIEFDVPVIEAMVDSELSNDELKVGDPSKVSKIVPPGFSSPVIGASSAQDAINSAIVDLDGLGMNGASWIEVNGEIGIVAMGSAPWDTRRSNPMLRLREQRLAWMEATMSARVSMARFVEGSSVQARQRLEKELSSRDTELLSSIESKDDSTELINSRVFSVVRGAMLYSVREDVEAERVSVTLVSTPGSQSLRQMQSIEVAETVDIQNSLDHLFAEIRSGVVAPTGGRLLQNPIDGNRVWISFGSAVVNPERTGPLRDAESEAARKTALLRAERAMISILNGESIEEEDILDSRYSRIQSKMDDLLVGTSDEHSETLSRQVTESNRQSVAAGKLPEDVAYYPLESSDGAWRYAVLVHGLMSIRYPSGDPESMTIDPSETSSTSEDGGSSSSPELVMAEVIVTRGTGVSLDLAIKNALLQAVSQVNGALISSDSVSTRKYEDAITDFNGRTDQTTNAQLISTEMIRATSSGLVNSYRILEQGVLTELDPEWNQGHRFFVRIQSDIPVFDPDNPRPGARPTIAVQPMAIGNIELPQGDRRMTGSRAADLMNSSMTLSLIENGRYTVLDEKYTREMDQMRDRILEQIVSGQAALWVFQRIGKELTADYVLAGTLESLSFRQWQEYLKVRKTYETRQEVAIDIEMRLINVATGEIEWMKRFNQSWTHPDLMRRSGAERNDSPIQFALSEASSQIDRSLMDYLNSMPRE